MSVVRVSLSGRKPEGGLKLRIGAHVEAELTHKELVQGWESACALSPLALTTQCRKAGERLAGALAQSDQPENLVEIAADAAVLFLLGIRRFNVWTPEEIPPCTVSYHPDRDEETLALSA